MKVVLAIGFDGVVPMFIPRLERRVILYYLRYLRCLRVCAATLTDSAFSHPMQFFELDGLSDHFDSLKRLDEYVPV